MMTLTSITTVPLIVRFLFESQIFLLLLLNLVSNIPSTVSAQAWSNNPYLYAPLSGDLKLGVVGKLTQRSGCGAARMVAASRAIYDINTRNSTYCPGIANLGGITSGALDTSHSEYFTVSADYLDNQGSSSKAIMGGLHFKNLVQIDSSYHGGEVHGIIGFTTSDTSISGAPAMQAAQLPMVCYSATSPLLSELSGGSLKYPNFFRVLPGDHNRVGAAANMIKHLGYDKAVSLYFSDIYTSSMCDFFRSTAEGLGMTIVNKELPTTGSSGSLPGVKEQNRIEEVLKEIHDDPTMPRAILMCAFDMEVPFTLAKATELGMRSKDSNYIWFSPDDGMSASDKNNLGVFTFKWETHSDRSDIFKQDYDSGEIPINQDHDHMFDQPICGPDQNKICYNSNDFLQHSPNPSQSGSQFFRYNETVSWNSDTNSWDTIPEGSRPIDDFDECKTYTQFGYDAVFMYAAAMHKGIKAGAFTKSTVTSTLLEAQLKSLVGDTTYGECLSPGIMTFSARQEKILPYNMYNLPSTAGGFIKVASIAADGTVTWDTSNVASTRCSQDNATACFNSDGTTITTQLPSGKAGVLVTHSITGNTFMSCIAGEYFTDGKCTQAPPGTFVAKDQVFPRLTTLCAPGTYTSVNGSSECIDAQAGYYVPDYPGTSESPCNAGSFSSEPRSAMCTPCNTGDFQNATGQSQCIRCPIGEYSSTKGAIQCQVCPNGLSTEFPGSKLASDCKCPEGTYLNSGGVCKECPPGIICNLGSDVNVPMTMTSQMRVKPGYYVPTDAIITTGTATPAAMAEKLDTAINNDVYVCDVLGEDVLSLDGYTTPCPGGHAGSCDEGRDSDSIACGRCLDDYFRNSEGVCEKCGGGEAVGLIFLFLFGIISPVGAYFFINSAVTARLGELTAALLSFGSLVTNVQLAVIVSKISVSWPAGIRNLFKGLSIFAFDLDSVRASCLIGQTGIASFGITLMIPILLALVLFGVAKLSRGMYPDETNKLHMKAPETWNTYFTVYQAVFIAIFLTVVRPLRCFPHPSGDRSSLVDYPDIICWEGGHSVMVVLTVIALISQVILFLVYYLWAILILPEASIKDINILRRLKFVVYRFRDGAWYWGIVFLIRNTFTGLAIIIDPSEPYIQSMLLSTTLLIYIYICVLVWPWKTTILNLADTVGCTCLLMMIVAAGPAMGKHTDQKLQDQVTAGALFFWCSGIGITMIFMFYSIYSWAKTSTNLLGNGKEKAEKKKQQRIRAAKILCTRLQHMGTEVTKMNPLLLSEAMADFNYEDMNTLLKSIRFMEIEIIHTGESASEVMAIARKASRMNTDGLLDDDDGGNGSGRGGGKGTWLKSFYNFREMRIKTTHMKRALRDIESSQHLGGSSSLTNNKDKYENKIAIST